MRSNTSLPACHTESDRDLPKPLSLASVVPATQVLRAPAAACVRCAVLPGLCSCPDHSWRGPYTTTHGSSWAQVQHLRGSEEVPRARLSGSGTRERRGQRTPEVCVCAGIKLAFVQQGVVPICALIGQVQPLPARSLLCTWSGQPLVAELWCESCTMGCLQQHQPLPALQLSG